MTEKVLEYCMRGIIRYLDGDKEQFNKYVERAISLDRTLCNCGGRTNPCRYNKISARICTDCGIVTIKKEVVYRCLVNSRRAV